MDLFEDEAPGGNAPEFTVSEVSGAVKRMIEGEFSHIRIRAEIGRVSFPRSGHVYLDLKDDKSVLASVIWKGVASRFPTRPEEGLEVIATGRLTTFPGQSKYQMVIEDMRPAGVGALMAMLEARKKKLEGEGLFDPARKRPLPYLPEIIGVVTSPSGAVIRDILHRLRDRFPRKVLIWPVAVQGEKCAPEVARAIEGFNRLTPGGAMPRPDVLIVARGGGSLEDLWGFNEEIVARAAAASDIPLISAVGHETDTTLIDFVSDRRAPTPTAAAEIAVPVRTDLMFALDDFAARLGRGLTRGLDLRGQRLRDLSRALPRPERLVEPARQRLDYASERLPAALRRSVDARRLRLSEAGGSLRPATLRRAIQTEADRTTKLAARLTPAQTRLSANRKDAFLARAARLRPEALSAEITRQTADLDRLTQRLADSHKRLSDKRAERLDAAGRLLETLSYRKTLERGYAVVRADSHVVTTKEAAQNAGAIEIEFADGRMRIGGAAKPAKKPKDSGPTQGSLF
ncbi:exodeoxyribonuclease VII large subunit [Donghicola eburneus]|uniref:Exodeoxyribonuclease 7 large subunit n=1 Tax=Donghicola eburneus TaxID=393278 RepID=A0A1M4N176_9RHOB|nr:exodeoxyribonuclease VII large subunit [Donghicola eburneus]SCM68571.1 Exodeoxyribonuclease 7 large subunit [Donghicola eburneus]SFQ27470.1 Exodeoxyribonuclease VII large subunit [Donghicola eburneus]